MCFANNFLCIARCETVHGITWTYSKSWPVTGFILSARLCAPSFQQILEVFSFLLPGSGGEFTFRDWSCQKGSSPLLAPLPLSLSRADKFLQDYPVVLRKIVRGEEEPVRRNRGDGGNLKGSYLNRVKRVENWEKMRRSWTFFGGGRVLVEWERINMDKIEEWSKILIIINLFWKLVYIYNLC